MKIKLEVSELVAYCLQRMIADEIDNQYTWYQNELAFRTGKTRQTIINEMHELADAIEKQGIQKHIKCY
jgi:NTP pyrophosphatase (non-canonical NTP hydrolase)